MAPIVYLDREHSYGGGVIIVINVKKIEIKCNLSRFFCFWSYSKSKFVSDLTPNDYFKIVIISYFSNGKKGIKIKYGGVSNFLFKHLSGVETVEV